MLVAGYLKLNAWNDTLLINLLQRARQQDCQVALNVCLTQGSQVNPRRCLKLMEYVDVFVLNEDEARTITHETTLSRQAQALHCAGARIVVITRGHKGLYADDGNVPIEMGVFSVPLTDPSGCGDCFSAGLIVGLLQHWDLARVLEFGSAVGALAATATGCTAGVPAYADVERYLVENRQTEANK